MRTNYKFHAIALVIICVLITGLYFLIGPKPAPAPVGPADKGRAIEIDSATWGEDCNPYIRDAIEKQQSTPAEKDEKGALIPREILKPIERNNVLARVSSMCNGKITCDITPTGETMGTNPLESCAKKLNLSYRCYSYDRLWNVSIGQGVTTTIDCNETAAPAGK